MSRGRRRMCSPLAFIKQQISSALAPSPPSPEDKTVSILLLFYFHLKLWWVNHFPLERKLNSEAGIVHMAHLKGQDFMVFSRQFQTAELSTVSSMEKWFFSLANTNKWLIYHVFASDIQPPVCVIILKCNKRTISCLSLKKIPALCCAIKFSFLSFHVLPIP